MTTGTETRTDFWSLDELPAQTPPMFLGIVCAHFPSVGRGALTVLSLFFVMFCSNCSYDCQAGFAAMIAIAAKSEQDFSTLFGIIYKDNPNIQRAAAGLFEIGLGVSINWLGDVRPVSPIYNMAVRFLPFIMTKLWDFKIRQFSPLFACFIKLKKVCDTVRPTSILFLCLYRCCCSRRYLLTTATSQRNGVDQGI